MWQSSRKLMLEAADAIERLEAENQRLETAKAENERLREDVRVLRSLNSKVCADEIDRLQAENERLKKAMRDAIESRDDYRKILSDALRLGISEI